jgi:hypothetical protein
MLSRDGGLSADRDQTPGGLTAHGDRRASIGIQARQISGQFREIRHLRLHANEICRIGIDAHCLWAVSRKDAAAPLGQKSGQLILRSELNQQLVLNEVSLFAGLVGQSGKRARGVIRVTRQRFGAWLQVDIDHDLEGGRRQRRRERPGVELAEVFIVINKRTRRDVHDLHPVEGGFAPHADERDDVLGQVAEDELPDQGGLQEERHRVGRVHGRAAERWHGRLGLDDLKAEGKDRGGGLHAQVFEPEGDVVAGGWRIPVGLGGRDTAGADGEAVPAQGQTEGHGPHGGTTGHEPEIGQRPRGARGASGGEKSGFVLEYLKGRRVGACQRRRKHD